MDFTIKKIKLTQFQLDRFKALIKQTRKSEDGYVYPDNEKHNSGYIVQSNSISYNDGNKNLTLYYSDYIEA